MRIVERVEEMRDISDRARREGKRIGLVPTMGYFHQGHLSLMREGRRRCDIVVSSVFVNPLQFGPAEDLDRYPRDIARDISLAEQERVDYLFCPDEKQMYPDGFKTRVEVGELSEVLCGRSRPGHFAGVCTVLLKLFNIVKPHSAFFGQKDAQQAIIIKRMVADLNLDIDIVVLPIVREEDGLAMSSRNSYLSPDERKSATVCYRALILAGEMIASGERSSDKIKGEMRKLIESEPRAEIDYIDIVETDMLSHLSELKGDVLIALAVFIGRTRLIDNIMVKV
jgi:pantoate--beta-alanine ligase